MATFPIENVISACMPLPVCVINRNGKVSDIEIVQSVSPSLDAEARRVIKSMPKWKPGMQNGKPVKTRFTLPLLFRLNNNKDSITPQEDSILTKLTSLFLHRKKAFSSSQRAFLCFTNGDAAINTILFLPPLPASHQRDSLSYRFGRSLRL